MLLQRVEGNNSVTLHLRLGPGLRTDDLRLDADPPSQTNQARIGYRTALRTDGAQGPNNGATCNSPTVEPPDLRGDVGDHVLSRRGRAADVAQNPRRQRRRDVGSRGRRRMVFTLEGYTSFIHNGMFVTRSVADGGGPDEDSWLYRPSIDYEASDGTRWEAWYQNGSFLQTKLAAPLAGSVYTGYQTSDRHRSLRGRSNLAPDLSCMKPRRPGTSACSRRRKAPPADSKRCRTCIRETS